MWGGIDQSFEQCGTGDNQSPVDIAEAIPADLPALEFDYPPTPLVVRNTGHVIEASLPEASDLTLTVEGTEYRLVSFHFHAPSEHTLDGESYEAEVHLVHRSADGELAVVAVLLEPSGLPSPLIGQVVDAAPGDAGQEVEFDEGLSPLELLLEFEPQARRRRLLHLSGLTDHARVHGRCALDRPPGHPRDPERHGRAPARAHR